MWIAPEGGGGNCKTMEGAVMVEDHETSIRLVKEQFHRAPGSSVPR